MLAILLCVHSVTISLLDSSRSDVLKSSLLMSLFVFRLSSRRPGQRHPRLRQGRRGRRRGRRRRPACCSIQKVPATGTKPCSGACDRHHSVSISGLCCSCPCCLSCFCCCRYCFRSVTGGLGTASYAASLIHFAVSTATTTSARSAWKARRWVGFAASATRSGNENCEKKTSPRKEKNEQGQLAEASSLCIKTC